jgi:PAS domain S-box-containing protein
MTDDSIENSSLVRATQQLTAPLEHLVQQRPAALETANQQLQQKISKRTLGEKALQDSEEHLRLFIAHAPVAIAMFDRQMRYVAASRRWLRDYGLGNRDLCGQSHYEVFPDLPDRWRTIHRQGLTGEVITATADRFDRADGTVQWLHWEVQPWYDTTGQGGIIIFTEDISQHKLAEQTLRESEEQLQLFFAYGPVSLAMFDRQMRYLAVSRRWMTEYLGGVGDVIGRSHYEVFPECPERWRTAHHRGLAGEVVREEEDRWEMADGTVLWARYEVRPWHTSDRTVGGIIIFTEDITERKRATEHILRLNAELEQRVRERTAQLEETVTNLQQALKEIKTLRGLLPICSYCKKIRNDSGFWQQLEGYLHDHTEAEFSHGLCPSCLEEHYGEFLRSASPSER